MRIVFTQFTPPFEHGKTEEEYLRYDDWFAKLRRAFAATDEVVFLSLTKEKHKVELRWDNYSALFFPVDNPDGRQRDGRLWYVSTPAIEWFERYRPDVVHVIGTGAEMAARILEKSGDARSFLWERCTVNERVLASPEVSLCDYYVHPTRESLQRAAADVPRDRLLQVPFGSDTEAFRPMGEAKWFDLVSAGRLTAAKQYGPVQRIVIQHNLSWLHAGGYVKGAPYSRWKDWSYSRNMRRIGLARGPKRSRDGRVVSGMFVHTDMPWVYNQARLMVHPSRGEGAARAVQEALACAVPVVVMADAVPWVEPEFGVKLDDLSALESTVMKLLADPAELERMGRRGREWLIEHHSFDRLHEAVRRMHALPKAMAAASGKLAEK